jgi:hypothetical protein
MVNQGLPGRAPDQSHRLHMGADHPLAGVAGPISDAHQPEYILRRVDAAGLAAIAGAALGRGYDTDHVLRAGRRAGLRAGRRAGLRAGRRAGLRAA